MSDTHENNYSRPRYSPRVNYFLYGLFCLSLSMAFFACSDNASNKQSEEVIYRWADDSGNYYESILNDDARSTVIEAINQPPDKVLNDIAMGLSTRHDLLIGDLHYMVNYPKCDSIRLTKDSSIEIWKIPYLEEILKQSRNEGGLQASDTIN